MIIFFMSLPFRRLDSKLQAQLPTRDGIEFRAVPEPDFVTVAVTRDRDAALYRLGDHAARDPRALVPALRDLGPARTYRIRASPEVAWEAVVRLVDLLVELELPKVQFAGGGPRLPGR